MLDSDVTRGHKLITVDSIAHQVPFDIDRRHRGTCVQTLRMYCGGNSRACRSETKFAPTAATAASFACGHSAPTRKNGRAPGRQARRNLAGRVRPACARIGGRRSPTGRQPASSRKEPQSLKPQCPFQSDAKTLLRIYIRFEALRL
jgi:hypothetical protein